MDNYYTDTAIELIKDWAIDEMNLDLTSDEALQILDRYENDGEYFDEELKQSLEHSYLKKKMVNIAKEWYRECEDEL